MQQIIDILNHRKRPDLARLLKSAHYEIDSSFNFGTYYNSHLATVKVFSPIVAHDQLKNLSKADRDLLLDVFLEIYPPENYGNEISEIRFLLDTDAPIPPALSQPEQLSQIDFTYITEQIKKCSDKIAGADYDGAITNARTLLETVCIYILGKSKGEYKDEGDLIRPYKQVIPNLNMDPQQHPEKFFKEILSEAFSIVNGLANIRNELSDAHGKSKQKHYKAERRHAVFAVEISKALSEFLYSSYAEKNLSNSNKPKTNAAP